MAVSLASRLAPAPADVPVRLRVLSLGAGVRSTTLALMATHGEVGPMPDCAIFADTGWEPRAVYRHLAWLMAPGVLSFPVHVVSAGNIRDDLLAGAQGQRWASIPAFTRTIVPVGDKRPVLDEDPVVGLSRPAGDRVSIGMIRRQCTADYKLVPIRRKLRELVGLAGRRSPKWPVVEQWIGVSLDESLRMKPSAEDWQVNRWPLVERRMTRRDCLLWLARHGYPEPPKSACIGCPFHSDAAWRRLRAVTPTPGRTPWRWTAPSARDSRGSAARSISTVRRCRWTRRIGPLTPTTDSSISGPTNARDCAACRGAGCRSFTDNRPRPPFTTQPLPEDV